MSDTPTVSKSAADVLEVDRLGAEIPSLGGANGRPANKKLIVVLAVIFLVIAGGLFYVLSKVSNRNKTTAVEKEVKQSISLPNDTERLVPPLELPSKPIVAAVAPSSAAASNNQNDAEAIALASEPNQNASTPRSLLPGLPGQPESSNVPGGAPVAPLAVRRSKLGGGLMAPDGEGGASASESAQSEMSWKKRLLPGNFLGDERSGTGAKASAAGPAGNLAGAMGAIGNALAGARGGASTGGDAAASGGAPADGGVPGGMSGDGSSASTLANGGLGSVALGGAATIEARRLATDRNYLIPRGSSISCVLDSRLVSDISGQTSCTVNTNVYSMNGAYRLIPKGSRLSGTYSSGAASNERLAIIWDRILTPEGIDVAISDPGTDAMGGTGVPGEFNGNWGKKLYTALLVSLAGDLFKLGTVKYGPTQTTTKIDANGATTSQTTPFESITVETLSKVPGQIAAKTLAMPGTITIAQGQLVKVVTTRDIDFQQARANP
jgi:type IV secretory pathway VirB10-like protein